jgi:hypothetical protein
MGVNAAYVMASSPVTGISFFLFYVLSLINFFLGKKEGVLNKATGNVGGRALGTLRHGAPRLWTESRDSVRQAQR